MTARANFHRSFVEDMQDMRMKRGTGVATGLLVLLATACSDSPTGNNGNQEAATANFSAKIDGTTWTSLVLGTSVTGSTNGNFTLVGSNSLVTTPTGLALSLYNIGAPGTYPLGVGPTVRGGVLTMNASSNAWSTALNGAAGSVTISSVSATRIAGSFAGNLDPLFGSATGTKSITAGTFDLAVNSPGSVAVADNKGSAVTGTLGGAAWNAATVVMVAGPATGTLTFGASTDAYYINVIVSPYIGVGPYIMNSGVSRYFTAISTVGTTRTWGGANLTSGTLVVTSATVTRIKGTFNVTMQTGIAQGGPAPLTFVGTFDIGVP